MNPTSSSHNPNHRTGSVPQDVVDVVVEECSDQDEEIQLLEVRPPPGPRVVMDSTTTTNTTTTTPPHSTHRTKKRQRVGMVENDTTAMGGGLLVPSGRIPWQDPSRNRGNNPSSASRITPTSLATATATTTTAAACKNQPLTISLLESSDEEDDNETIGGSMETSAVRNQDSPTTGTTRILNPYWKRPRSMGSNTSNTSTTTITTTETNRVTPGRDPSCQKQSSSPSSNISNSNSNSNSNNNCRPTSGNPYLARKTTSATSAAAAAAAVTKSMIPSFGSHKLLFSYPKLLDQTKSYPDLRAQYCLAFWKACRKWTHHSYHRQKLDQMASRIVYLALNVEFAVRSPDEYCQRLKGRAAGGFTHNVGDLKDLLQREGADRIKTPPCVPPSAGTITNAFPRQGPQRTFYTIPEAALVAMLEHVAPKLAAATSYSASCSWENLSDEHLSSRLHQKEYWLSVQTLLPLVDERLKQQVCPARLTRPFESDHGVAHYEDPSTRSAEYLQLIKLTVKLADQEMPYLLRHKWNGRSYLELTRRGFRKALEVRNRPFPAPNGHYRTSNLYQGEVKANFRGICLAVDRNEGGGDAHNLHKMCNKLDMTGLPYFVGTLSIGDYCFFSGNKLCPLLVERKSIEDVAISVSDGRWESQKKRMYQGQYVFGYSTCRIAYIIEGKEETQQVTGGFIGHRKHNVSRETLDELIGNLEGEGFDVLRTSSPEHSMFELSRWAARVLQEAQGGQLEIKYTYQEFKDLVKAIPPQVDFSRMAKDAMQTRLATSREREKQRTAILPVVQELEKETSDLQPMVLDSRLKGIPNKTKTSTAVNNKYLTTDRKFPAVMGSKPAAETAFHSSSRVDYSKWTTSALRQQCVEWGLSKSGPKLTLMERLYGPRRPQVLMDREAQQQYSPKSHDVGANALLVGLVLEQCQGGRDPDPSFQGSTKDGLYVLAESLQITKNPFSGGTTQTGPYLYDGWSNMKYLLQGDPPLVHRVKGGRYKLTTCGPLSGVPMAKAVHQWCHAHHKCSCEELGYIYHADDWN